jgi:hypothetical protein
VPHKPVLSKLEKLNVQQEAAQTAISAAIPGSMKRTIVIN